MEKGGGRGRRNRRRFSEADEEGGGGGKVFFLSFFRNCSTCLFPSDSFLPRTCSTFLETNTTIPSWEAKTAQKRHSSFSSSTTVGSVPQLLASFAPTTEMPYESGPHPLPPSPHASAHGKQQPAFVPYRNKAAAATVVGFPLLFRQLHDRIHIYCRLF